MSPSGVFKSRSHSSLAQAIFINHVSMTDVRPCFQAVFNAHPLSSSVSVRVFRRSTRPCRFVELRWVQTRKGFRICRSTAWSVRPYTALSTPYSKHQTCRCLQHHHVSRFQGKVSLSLSTGWFSFLKEHVKTKKNEGEIVCVCECGCIYICVFWVQSLFLSCRTSVSCVGLGAPLHFLLSCVTPLHTTQPSVIPQSEQLCTKTPMGAWPFLSFTFVSSFCLWCVSISLSLSLVHSPSLSSLVI